MRSDVDNELPRAALTDVSLHVAHLPLRDWMSTTFERGQELGVPEDFASVVRRKTREDSAVANAVPTLNETRDALVSALPRMGRGGVRGLLGGGGAGPAISPVPIRFVLVIFRCVHLRVHIHYESVQSRGTTLR